MLYTGHSVADFEILHANGAFIFVIAWCNICDVTYYCLDNIALLQQEAGALGLAKLSVFTS